MGFQEILSFLVSFVMSDFRFLPGTTWVETHTYLLLHSPVYFFMVPQESE